MRIVFMGTPDFAVPSLQKLLESRHEVVGVFTQPDRPRGRGYALTACPVKQLALEAGVLVFSPVRMKDGTAAKLLAGLRPDLVAVAAYGRILPPDILAVPPAGCINLHGSLLPRYRGAAPIQRSLMAGDRRVGVTTMYMAEGLDTGDMILSAATDVDEADTAETVSARLAQLGAGLLIETIDRIEAGTAPRTPQDDAAASWAPMLEKADGLLNFAEPAAALAARIRGVTPWPGAYTYLAGKTLKVFRLAPAPGFAGAPGEVLDARRFIVGAGDGAVELLEIQPEGKKRMNGADFLRGARLQAGARLGKTLE